MRVIVTNANNGPPFTLRPSAYKYSRSDTFVKGGPHVGTGLVNTPAREHYP